MKYVSIDIETTGLEPGFHQMIEFGAALEDTENPVPTCQLPTFRALISHEGGITISPYCIKLHKDLLAELAEKQVKHGGKWFVTYDDGSYLCQPDCLKHLFTAWLKEHGLNPKETKVVVAGKNFNKFDINFIEPLFMSQVKFHRRVMDPVTLFTLPTDQEPPNLGECAKRAGLEFTGNGYHSAVADAIMVIELLRAGWKRLEN